LFALVPRRLAWVVPAVALVLLAASSVSASRVVAAESTLFAPAMVGADERWIDHAGSGPVAYVYAGERGWSGGGPVWMNLFWNDRIHRVYDLFGVRAAGPLPQTATRIGRGGLLEPAVTQQYVVASARETFGGTRVATNPGAELALWRVRPPARLVSREYGIDRVTGIVSGAARILGYGCRGGRLLLSIGAPEDRLVDVQVNGRIVRTIALRMRVPWRGAVEAPAGARCSFVVQGRGGGFYFDRLAFEPSP
jgi:hypothetical protein